MQDQLSIHSHSVSYLRLFIPLVQFTDPLRILTKNIPYGVGLFAGTFLSSFYHALNWQQLMSLVSLVCVRA